MNRVFTLPAEIAEIAGETSSTLKAFGVLEVLVRAGRAVALSELVQATDLPKLPLHCCASGKLLLAHLPAPERQGLLAVLPLERFTERTITDRAVLESELDRIVSVGYAVDNEEYVLGVACVAVPVRNRSGDVIASLAVQGATARLPLMRAIEFIPRLRAAAAEIGSTFG